MEWKCDLWSKQEQQINNVNSSFLFFIANYSVWHLSKGFLSMLLVSRKHLWLRSGQGNLRSSVPKWWKNLSVWHYCGHQCQKALANTVQGAGGQGALEKTILLFISSPSKEADSNQRSPTLLRQSRQSSLSHFQALCLSQANHLSSSLLLQSLATREEKKPLLRKIFWGTADKTIF